jgi:RNA polymerase sigma factor (sigma-70 family)
MAPVLGQRAGVDRAFERLYRRHALDVYRYAYAVLRNQADAEDVAQTTFMNAYRALERGETPQSPHNWLIAIAHNVCRQRFRQASRRVQEVGLDEDVADRFVRPEDDDAPSAEDIRRAIGHLAFNQRAALVMRELEGRSYGDIADVLGISVGAAETLIFRARRALREQLDVSLTCGQAEQAISRQLDGRLSRADRSQLRAHLRECAECRRFARSHRAQRSALKAFGAVPLPQSLATLFGGGAAVATKAAVVVVATGLVGGVGWDVHHRLQQPAPRPAPAASTLRAKPAVPQQPVAAVRPAIATAVAPVHHAHHAHHVVAARPSAAAATVHGQQQHPAHPVHPATPVQPAHPAHPRAVAKPTHPAQPAKRRHPVTQSQRPHKHAVPRRTPPKRAPGKPLQQGSDPLQELDKGIAQEVGGSRHLHP